LPADIARQTQHLDAEGQHPDHLVEPLAHVDRLEDLLLLLRLQVHHCGDEVASAAAESRPWIVPASSGGAFGTSCSASIARCFSW